MMETKNLVGMILAVTVGLICIGTVMMPILSEATQTSETFTNTGLFDYGVFTSDDEYTLTFDSTDGLAVNGTAVSIDGVSVGVASTRYSVIATDNLIIRYGSATDSLVCQIVGVDSDGTGHSPACYTLTVTISDGQIVTTHTTTDGGDSTTYTFDFTEMYAIVPTEDVAVLKVATDEVYITGDSELYASGLTTVSHWSNFIHFEGTYDDGITITSPNMDGVTFDNIEWNIEAVDGYVDLYKLTSVEFDVTYNDTTVHATYSYFAVPSEVSAELSSHFDTTQIAILMVLPILMIIAVLLVAVRGFTRYD